MCTKIVDNVKPSSNARRVTTANDDKQQNSWKQDNNLTQPADKSNTRCLDLPWRFPTSKQKVVISNGKRACLYADAAATSKNIRGANASDKMQYSIEPD